MRFILAKDGEKTPLTSLSFQQSRQAAALVDAIARLIPQEGVDYNIAVTFKGDYVPTVSLDISSLTDKGEFWREYVLKMLKKYPPTVDFHGDVLPDEPADIQEKHNAQKQRNRNKGDKAPEGGKDGKGGQGHQAGS